MLAAEKAPDRDEVAAMIERLGGVVLDDDDVNLISQWFLSWANDPSTAIERESPDIRRRHTDLSLRIFTYLDAHS